MEDNKTQFRPSVEKRYILLIEDELINQEILKMYINEDYEVLSAFNGAEAISILQSQYDLISLILLDLNLPDVHGLDLLREIKSDSRYARIPVIVMTADSEAEVECLTLGAIDFIPKPYPQQKVVLARILRTIELSEDRDILRWTERDQLTGLYNKQFFYRYAIQMDLYHKEAPTDAILMNINHFHTINDRYGKNYGDQILRHIGNNILNAVQKSGGIACRSEADTFMIYCPHRDDYEDLLEEVSVFSEEGAERENRIHLRMGVYSCADKELDIERRFDRAKLSSDKVKGSFTRAIGIYDDSMHEEELLAERLIEGFQAALREKQFMVYYQPKVNVSAEEPFLSSAEALVRWQHPELGLVSPATFIPLFEQNGLIQTLDHYVWEEVVDQIRDWKDRHNITLPVSVNVSRIDMHDPDLVGKLQQLIEKNGLAYQDLLLEITESAYTEDSDQMIEKVKQLRKIGFQIEMDDFGSGYSSLNMLSTLPIDALKLDMQFIRNAFKERKDTRLLETMIQLAEAFEVPTVAEGVETAEQAFTLKAMGCDIIQGYYFSPPLPAGDFEQYLLENRPQKVDTAEKVSKPRRDKFTYKALHDSLTGLYNYSAFDILFHDSDHDHIAVLVADIDRYGELRSIHGQDYADRVVLRVAEVLRNSFRSVDHICRLQEDEFTVIMTRVTSDGKDLVFNKIEQLSRELRREVEGMEAITLSIGVAFSDREMPGGDVFQDADTALKRLKDMRKTGYAVF